MKLCPRDNEVQVFDAVEMAQELDTLFRQVRKTGRRFSDPNQ